ncbi:MAG: hypothetical protein IJ920_05140 [Paludibacteraceae bacterium]|nr:hypothetical protein [Paludibacteraceae bacterium]
MAKDIHSYLKAVYKEITAERICDWTSSPKESDKGVLRRLDSAFGFEQDAAHPDIRKKDENVNGLLRILEKHVIEDNEVKDLFHNIQKQCDDIKEMLYLYMMADYQQFHDKSTRYFNEVFANINNISWGISYQLPAKSIFYRMRRMDKSDINDRLNFFHVPFTKRYLMGTYRYSIPGYPSFYSASSLYCCWEELDRPHLRECGCSAFQTTIEVPLLDLRWKIDDVDILKKENIEKLKHYILRLPIIIACSLRVKDTPDKFVPEYVISQQVFQWLMSELRKKIKRKEKMTVGIIYTSAKSEIWKSFQTKEIDSADIMTNYALLSYLSEDENINTYSRKLATRINIKNPLYFEERISPITSIYQTLLAKEKELTIHQISKWRNLAKYIKH